VEIIAYTQVLNETYQKLLYASRPFIS